MNPEIIIMLTNNDITVTNAEEVFESCKDLPAKKWGFKDVGLPKEEMIQLAKKMKDAGKETYIEVVTYTEEGCPEGAKLAYECGFDYLTGALPFDSVFEYAKEHGYDTVTTTLLYSIYQKHDFIKKLMEQYSEEYGIDFLYRDFRVGFWEGHQKAHDLGLYMQKYCGCIFSEEDRYSKQIKRDKE